jgi:hypothetical protein
MPTSEQSPAVRPSRPLAGIPDQQFARRTKRPRAITAAACVFIVVGAGGSLKDVLPLLTAGPVSAQEMLLAEGPVGLALIWTVRLLAVIGGALVLHGSNRGRWLLVAWMAFHVGLSLFHSPLAAAAHIAIFSALTYVLFRREATNYFVAAAEGSSRGDRDGKKCRRGGES